MNNKITIGCDISKEKLDFFCRNTEEHFILENNKDGMLQLSKWIKQHKFNKSEIEIGFEHTGIYTTAIRQFCNEEKLTHYIIPGLELKKSLGMARGKNDVVDSKRICEYVFEKSYKLKPTNAINTSISNLKRLDSLREKLVSDRAGLITRMNEEIEMLELNETDFGIKIQRDTIEMLSEKIELIDTEMEIELTKDISIKKNFDLLNTIVGIGKITAYQLIITTENFIKFDNPRKYASYAGVAPFTKQSGKSEGRTKVSGLANKKVKTLLDMCARSAMLNDPELKLYYKRKVLEGKNNRLVRNAIRFKLLTRVFSVIKKQTPFVKNHVNNLVISMS